MPCFVGDGQEGESGCFAAALGAQAVQQEVQQIAHKAAEWLQHWRFYDASEASKTSAVQQLSPQYEGLCMLCLLPLEVVAMPTVQIHPEQRCLVSCLALLKFCVA